MGVGDEPGTLSVPVPMVQSAVVEERRRFRDAELVGHSGSWDWDITSGVISWSDGLFALHGLDPVRLVGGYEQAASRVHEDDRALVDETMAACGLDDAVHQFRYRIYRASDGAIRWFDSRAQGVFHDGRLIRLTGAVADVTERVLAEEALEEANRFLEAILAASPDFTFITNVRTGALVYGSQDNGLGWESNEFSSLVSDPTRPLVHPEDREALNAMIEESTRMRDGEFLQMRCRLRRANGSWVWVNRLVVPFRRDELGDVVEVLGVVRVIDDLVKAEEVLLHGALHDPLTGLPNRSLLMDRLEAAISRSLRERRDIGVLYCDLDGFKEANDSAGHAAGDAILIESGQRLLSAVREGDTVARIGGDEFVLLVEPWNRQARTNLATGAALSVEVANRILRAFSRPFVVNGASHDVTVSVGVAVSSADATGTNAERAATLLENADRAMYAAKNAGKNRLELFGGP
ncbi:MAG: diguanylate cyclase [Acidimicrobiales bacterium]